MSDLTRVEARELTDEIRGDLDGLLPKIRRAFEGRADKALGYDSWSAYCVAELSDVRIPVGSRPDMVAELRGAGMSTRAIGSALGVDHATVVRDLKPTGASAPVDRPERVVSLDGRSRPASKPVERPAFLPPVVAEAARNAVAEVAAEREARAEDDRRDAEFVAGMREVMAKEPPTASGPEMGAVYGPVADLARLDQADIPRLIGMWAPWMHREIDDHIDAAQAYLAAFAEQWRAK